MRILQLTQRFPPALGGVEEHVLQISHRLARAGHAVSIFTSDLEKDKPFVRLPSNPSFCLHGSGIQVTRFTAVRVFDLKHGVGIIIPQMLPATLKEKVDVVHAHGFGFWPTYVGMVKKLVDQTPLIITPHSNPGSRDFGLMDFRKLPLKEADQIIALTNLEKKHLIWSGVNQNKISVIPNGIDVDKFKPSSDVPTDRNLVLFVGKINIEHKGVDTLIKSVPLVLRSVPKAKFVLVGPDWGDLAYLKKLSITLGVEDYVSFVGSVSETEKIEHLAKARVCVVPSNIEPFGIVVLESMACGKPVIASRVGGIPEILRNKEHGILVEAGNPRMLSEAISFVLQDSIAATKMSEFARREAQKYTWDSVVAQVEKAYKKVCRAMK